MLVGGKERQVGVTSHDFSSSNFIGFFIMLKCSVTSSFFASFTHTPWQNGFNCRYATKFVLNSSFEMSIWLFCGLKREEDSISVTFSYPRPSTTFISRH